MMNREEFERTLLHGVDEWGAKKPIEVEVLIGKAAAGMVGFDQKNPHHCYDLWQHTLHVVDGCRESDSIYLKVAAFFHDIGKPDRAMKKNGHFVFYGHPKKSAELAMPILKQLRYNQKECALIGFYIRHHDDFISWVLPEEPYNHHNPYHITITKAHLAGHLLMQSNDLTTLCEIESKKEIWKNLLILCRADASAQAEIVIQNGKEIDSKAHKLAKADRLLQCLEALSKK